MNGRTLSIGKDYTLNMWAEYFMMKTSVHTDNLWQREIGEEQALEYN